MENPSGAGEPPSEKQPSAATSCGSSAFQPFPSSWFPTLIQSRWLALFTHDRSGAVVDANPGFCDLVGYSREEIAGLSLGRLLFRPQLSEYLQFVEKRHQDPSSPGFLEISLRRKDGNEVWIEADCPVVPENGTAQLTLVAARDITSRKADDQRLREYTGKYQALFENSEDIIAVMDRDAGLIDINPKFEEELGVPRAELSGKNLTSPEIVTTESADRIRLNLKEVIDGKSQAVFGINARHKSGRRVPYEVNVMPLRGEAGVTAVLASLRDISQRRDMEEALRNSEETSRVLLNAAQNAAFLIDVQGRILSVNPEAAQMMGMPIEELVGKLIAPCLPPDTAEFRRQKNLEVIRTGQPIYFEDEAGGKTFSSSVHPICDDRGHVIKLAIYSKDMTAEKRFEEERKKLTAQLQQAQKMEAIGTLAGGIAHDFNNLLMAIQGNVSLILFDMEAAHPHHRILANIERLIRSGADLTSKLLGYARRGKYESRPLALNDLVRETSDTFGRMRKDITIYRDLAENLKSIIADKGQLEQVLLNLFVNAADAMPAGGKLILRTRNLTHQEIPSKGYTIKPGAYVLLTVTDTGVGMERGVMARIFDPFFTTKKIGRGTGLGLASAYGIIKSHNGYIEVESEKEKGSTFYVYLPATDQRTSVDSAPSMKPAAGTGTILLVDDEQMVLEVTAQMIQRLGYTVIRARNGREAIERFRENPGAVSLVILDMIMPEMGGGEVFDQLKRIDPRVKVLLASGYSMQGQAREIMNRGCIGFIQKPFTLQDLSIRLLGILNPP
jgi:PAS domain S-box-containing protein